MKHGLGYTINPSAAVFVFDTDTFLRTCANTGSTGYVFEHVFEKNKIILFSTVVVTCLNGGVSDKRFDEVLEIYGIAASKKIVSGNDQHRVFTYRETCMYSDHSKQKEALGMLFPEAEIKDFYPYPDGTKNIEEFSNDAMLEKNDLYEIRAYCTDNYTGFSGKNLAEIEVANNAPIAEIQKLLETALHTDEKLNVIVGKGRPFKFVLGHLESMNQAMLFFNDNFGTQFKVYEIVSQTFGKDGIDIELAKGAYKGDFGYNVETKKGPRAITDFYISVHYMLENFGQKLFIVTIVNPRTGEKAEKVRYPNFMSGAKLGEFLQKLGNFHFLGKEKEVSILHASLSNSNPPLIRSVVGFGFMEREQVLLLKNGIWDMKEKCFTEKKDDEDFYLNFDGRGFMPTSSIGDEIFSTEAHMCPALVGTRKQPSYEELVRPLRKMYSDDTADLVLMYTMSLVGYGNFSGDASDDLHPMLFVRGITGTGKSTFIMLMQKLLGLSSDVSQSYPDTSRFAMTQQLCHFNKLPVFYTEFREADMADNRGSLFRVAYDRKGTSKGRPDLTTVKFKYVSIPVFDAEEIFKDGALRTRCVQQQMKKRSRVEADVIKIMKEEGGVLDEFLYAYLVGAKRGLYDTSFDKADEIFRDKAVEPRILQSFKKIFAGCMAYAPEEEERFVKILQRVLKFQTKDFAENGTSQDIVKLVSRYLESYNAKVYCADGMTIVSWNAITDFAVKNRVKTILGNLDSYMEHLEGMGFKMDFYDCLDPNGFGEQQMIYGVGVPPEKIPKAFMVHKVFYEKGKKYMLTKPA